MFFIPNLMQGLQISICKKLKNHYVLESYQPDRTANLPNPAALICLVLVYPHRGNSVSCIFLKSFETGKKNFLSYFGMTFSSIP
jgi:hypothetical protein